MATQRDFQVIMKNTDFNDAEELRDVLTMLGHAVDEQANEIEQIKQRLDRVNEAYPSTAA